MLVTPLLLLLTGLAFLADDGLVIILDAFALVGFRRTFFTDFSRELSDLLFVGTGNDDLVGLRNIDMDTGNFSDIDRVRNNPESAPECCPALQHGNQHR